MTSGGRWREDAPLGLPLWASPLPEEPAHGLLMRLCSINAYSSLPAVMKETDLAITELRRGRQIERLAAVVHRPVADVGRWTVAYDGGSDATIAGQTIAFKRDLDCQRRRACPACLRDSNHHRFWWDLHFISCCPRHGLRLTDACGCGAGRLTWRDARVHRGRCCRDGDLRSVAGEAAPAAMMKADTYMLGRLGVMPAIAVTGLDELAISDVVDVTSRVGALEKEGWAKRWNGGVGAASIPADLRMAGFAVIAENRMQEVLEKVFEEFIGMKRKTKSEDAPVLTTAYGWFYHWYNHRGHQAFSTYLTEEIYSHAAKNFRIDRRAMRNKSVTVSAGTVASMDRFDEGWMTLSSAAKACGCHLMQVRLVASTYGLMRAEKKTGRAVLLAEADVGTLSFIMRNRASRIEAAKALGTDARVAEDLVVHGVLTPLLHAGRDGIRVNTFLKQDVEDLAKDLLARCRRSASANGPERSFLQTRLRVRLDILCAAIASGEVKPRYGAKGRFALRHVWIDEQDVEMLAQRSERAVPPLRDPAAKMSFDHWRKRVAEIIARDALPIEIKAVPVASGRRRACTKPAALTV